MKPKGRTVIIGVMATDFLADYCARAIAKHEARHATTDSLLFNTATFVRDGAKYIVTVAGHVVLETHSLSAVREFSEMHNGRVGEALNT